MSILRVEWPIVQIRGARSERLEFVNNMCRSVNKILRIFIVISRQFF